MTTKPYGDGIVRPDCPGCEEAVCDECLKSEYTKKPSNPKDSVGIKKFYYSVIPWNVIGELGVALLEGALKYGRHNYRGVGVRASVYYDAALRHLTTWWEGEDIDPDSDLSHITKAIASLTVLRDSMLRNNWSDDRPPRTDPEWTKELNKRAAALVDKYPEPAKVWTHES